MSYALGLMIGSSADCIDAAIIHIKEDVTFVKGLATAIPTVIKNNLINLNINKPISTFDLNRLEYLLSKCLVKAAKNIMSSTNLAASQIEVVGVHGFTCIHQPDSLRSSVQLVNPSLLAQQLGVKVVADFRRMDIANGGQGAPFAPVFHHYLWGHRKKMAVLNIGGMANIATWNADSVFGFDTGPGNVLLDAWIKSILNLNYDNSGNWASQGIVINDLLIKLQTNIFFKKQPPKSTSRDQFNLQFITNNLVEQYNPCDVQATLAELTAWSIANAINDYCSWVDTIYVCGGGVYNLDLLNRLARLSNKKISSTHDLGWHPDWLEAAIFAWLGKQRLTQTVVNLQNVTGAKKNSVLGAMYLS